MPKPSFSSFLKSWTIWCPWVLVGGFVAVFLSTRAGRSLAFDRHAILAGEYWRLVTGHWTHFTHDHLFWDVTVFGILGSATLCRFPRAGLACLLSAHLTITIGLWLWLPHLIHYRGLSGIDAALFCFLAAATLCSAGRRPVRSLLPGLLLLAGFAWKLGYELTSGQLWFVQDNANFVPLPQAHALGGLTGLIWGVGVTFMDRK